ncbi:DUF3450 domain-containing protein [Hahella sp. HN01]|uniref:DUF3450 domain-containing protein n=1 Tax=Hahella sp. HN01 TaxID=2847262 RepID=UPI001C1EA2AA|nr:DUF3450 domain-containing protein [Hahella sp. HN01]MBU6953110.1 DUF3450 domain-containing protein [Hahella sp. HN01]
MKIRSISKLLIAAPLAGLTLSLPAYADTLGESVAAQTAMVQSSQQSQARVDKLADQSDELLSEYKNVIRQIEGLKAYNDQNERIVSSQQAELSSLNTQISALEQTRTEVVPLMLRMVSALEQFVEADVPFQMDERRKRVADLRALMDRADVSTSEKFRKILEAYEVENEYGRTIEAYKASLGEGEQLRTYEFLRIGRIALMYQTPDGAETGHWNKDKKQWEALPETYRSAVSQGLKIAKKQAPPALIKLPVLAARAK